MASGTTAHTAHHSFSIDYHVQAPPSHTLLSFSTEGDDDYYTPPASGRASPEEMTPVVEKMRQLSIDSPHSIHYTRSPSGSFSRVESPTSGSFESFDPENDYSSVRDFLAEEDDPNFHSDYPRGGLDHMSTALSIQPVSRSPTYGTVSTVVSHGVLELELSELCGLILTRASLARAEIVSAECYAQRIGIVTHRFLILHLRRDNRKDMWLRMDRRAMGDVSLMELLWSSGQTQARDEAQLSPNKNKLLGTGDPKAENMLRFETPPTLADLEIFLKVICDELKTYKAWPENCWFFCSLLQQYLAASKHSTFSFGTLMHSGLAREVRLRIYDRIRLIYHMPEAPSLTALLEGIQRSGDLPESATKLFSETMAYSLRYDKDCMEHVGPDFAPSVSGLALKLRDLAEVFETANNRVLACLVDEQSVFFHREVARQMAWMWKSLFSESLLSYALNLQKMWRMDKARQAIDEAVEIRQLRYKRNPERHRERYVDFLFTQTGIHFSSRDPATCASIAHQITPLARAMVASDANKYRTYLARAHRETGFELTNLLKFAEARLEHNEGISHFRRALKRAPDDAELRREFALALYHYAETLHGAHAFEEALVAIDEAITLFQGAVGEEDSPKTNFQAKFDTTQSFQRKAVILSTSQRYDEACSFGTLAAEGYRVLYRRAPLAYRGSLITQALTNTGDYLTSAGLFSEGLEAYRGGLAAAREFLTVVQSRYEADPEYQRAELALAYNHIKLAQVKCMDFQDVCDALERSVSLCRDAAERTSSHYLVDLALYLREFGMYLYRRRRFQESYAAQEEAQALYRRFAKYNPLVHENNLALVLYEQSKSLGMLERLADAARTVQECVSVIRKLYKGDPDRHRLLLAHSLFWSAHFHTFSHGQQYEDACAAILESAALYRERYAKYKFATAADLASCLWLAGNTLTSAGGREVEARAQYEEAHAIYEASIDDLRRFYDCDVGPRGLDFAEILRKYAHCLHALRRVDEAVERIREAIAVHRAVEERDPGVYVEGLARALCFASLLYLEQGVFKLSLETGKEAVALFRPVHISHPMRCDEVHSYMLWVLARSHVLLNQWDEAREAMEESLALPRPFTTKYYPKLDADWSELTDQLRGKDAQEP